MTDDKRRTLIDDYLTATVAGDVSLIGSFFTDDCRVWLVPSAQKHGLPRPLEGRQAFLDLVERMSDSPAHWKARSFTAQRLFFDGDAVAAHLRLVGDMPNGAVYDNEYVFLLTFDGDKICEMREFTDAAFINDFLAENG